MDDILHNFLNKLRIISTIKSGDKLDTIDDLNIYVEGYMNWLKRKYYYDGKESSVRVLHDLYRGVSQYSEQLISEISNTKSNVIRSSKISTATNLAEKIALSIKGLENLTITYKEFPKTKASLEGLVCDYAMITYKSLLSNIPHELHNDILCGDVKYLGKVVYRGIDFNAVDADDDYYVDDTSSGDDIIEKDLENDSDMP